MCESNLLSSPGFICSNYAEAAISTQSSSPVILAVARPPGFFRGIARLDDNLTVASCKLDRADPKLKINDGFY